MAGVKRRSSRFLVGNRERLHLADGRTTIQSDHSETESAQLRAYLKRLRRTSRDAPI
jgi:hypothetical protein